MENIATMLLVSTLATNPVPEHYTLKIDKVVDGDTIKTTFAGIPFGFDHINIRLANIDSAEIHGKCPLEKQKAIDAKNHLSALILNKLVTIQNCKADKYFRWNCDVFYHNENVSEHMIKNGYAISYHGEKKTKDWCELK